MKCPHCGAVSEVVETKGAAYLTVIRRRRCFNEHLFKTVEIHLAVFSTAKQRAIVFAATATQRIVTWKRNREIARRLPLEGHKALQEEFGLTKSAVYYAAKQARKP